MGLHPKTFILCSEYFKENIKIAELGAQIIYGEEWDFFPRIYFKNHFSNLDITSFDISGENNSLIVNLSNQISEIFKNNFEIVTNFGTTEHIQNQYICWKNIFEMTKLNGIVISEVPKKGYLPGHCKYYYDSETFKSMEKDFEIISSTDRFYSNGDVQIFCIMKKKHEGVFLTEENDLLNKIEIIEDFKDAQGF